MYVFEHTALTGIPRLVSLALLCLTLSTTASASIIHYQVEGIFDSGSLSGKHYSQTFSFDDTGRPAVPGALPWETALLSFSLNVEGMSKQWTIADWPLAHTFSEWVDGSGYLNSVAYLATPGPLGETPAFVRYHDDGAPTSRSSHVKWYDWSVWNTVQTDSTDSDPEFTISVVPEPSALAFWMAGLIGMFAMGQRRNRQG